MRRWEIVNCSNGETEVDPVNRKPDGSYLIRRRLDGYLADGWEPFAVTASSEYRVWLRREMVHIPLTDGTTKVVPAAELEP